MKKSLQILLYLILAFPTLASEWKEKTVQQALQNFESLERANSKNEIEGHGFLNQYVIDLSPNWIEERPNLKLLKNNFDDLSRKMIQFNSGRTDKLRFYVIVVNDYQAEVEETLDFNSIPSSVDNLGDFVRFPQKNEGYARIKSELTEIPLAIAAVLKEKGYSERIVYFYSRVKLYKLDNKERFYYHDNLTLLGENIEKYNNSLREAAKGNISKSDPVAFRIDKLVSNIINAVEVVIDNGQDINIRCDDTYANLIEKTFPLRSSENIEQAALGFAGILDKAGPSQFVVFEGLGDLRDEGNYFSVILPDKLRLLADANNKSPFKVYIVGKKVDFVFPNNELDDFAKAVALKSGKNDGKTIFIVLPYFQLSCTNYTSPQGWYGQPIAEGTALYAPGIYSPDEALAKKMATALRGPGSFAASFDQAFKCIPKKHVEYRYIISYDFNLVALETKVNQNVSGYENIYDLNISVDQRLKKYIELQLKRKDWTSGLSVGGLQDITKINDQLTALAAQSPTFYRLEHGLIESWLSESVDNKRNYYSKVAEQYVYWFANKKLKSIQLWQESTTYDFSGIAYNSPPPHYFVTGHNPEVLEEQFDMLDKAGMGLALFNLDWATDAAGFLLACRYKSTGNKYIYGAALATPVVCAVILRRGAKVFKKANNTFEIVEEAAGEFAGIYGKLKNELKWSDELIGQFEKDFAGNVDIVKKFEIGELSVDSWKALAEFPNLRKIPTNLEVLNKVKGKFAYNGKVGQEALEEIFTGHKSAQKFIDNFKKYDVIIGNIDDITVTGIKSSSEVRILNKGSQVGKIIDGKLNVNYSGFGGDIVCDPNKTTTLLGKWEDPSGGGTSEIINSKLSKSGQNTGGSNVLSEDIAKGWSDQQIWDNVNEPWLRSAANRGDVIRVVSDPTKTTNIYKQGTELSFFGREHELLTKPVSQGGLGYTYNPSTFIYTK